MKCKCFLTVDRAVLGRRGLVGAARRPHQNIQRHSAHIHQLPGKQSSYVITCHVFPHTTVFTCMYMYYSSTAYKITYYPSPVSVPGRILEGPSVQSI